MKTKLFFPMLVFSMFFSHSYGQGYRCGVTSSQEAVQSGLQKGASLVETTGEQNLVILFVDFFDGRKSGNILPTQDSDTALVANIDAVGGMGWVKINPDDPNPNAPKRKKIRKYTYDDYWDMFFTQGTYNGAVHPDNGSHSIEVYGSFKDYYNEVSYGNFTIVPYTTHGTGSNKYEQGIINAIDEDPVTHKKYIRWAMMPNNKNTYPNLPLIPSREGDDIDPILDTLLRRGETTFNRVGYNGKIMVVCAGGPPVANIIGIAQRPGTYSEITEKVLSNTNSQAKLAGIADAVHEFGHNLGFPHIPSSTYDIMNPYIFASIKYNYCPSHFNPIFKFQVGWISTTDFVKLCGNGTINLSPSDSNQSFGTVTLYGDALRNNDYTHSEYFVLEYRTRQGFNRFTGGEGADTFPGGVLVWHYSPYTPFQCFGTDGGATIGLKVDNPENFVLNWGDPNNLYYSAHNSLNSSTLPNSSSKENLTTGISLSNFTITNNQIAVNVQYDSGAVPTYMQFYARNADLDSISGNVYIEGGENNVSSTTINDGATITIAPNATLILKNINSIPLSQGGIVWRGVGYTSTHAKWSTILLQSSSTLNIQKNIISDLTGSISIEIYADIPRPILTNNNFTNGPPTIELSIGSMDNSPYEVWFPDLTNTNYGALKISRGIWRVPNGQNITIPVSSSWTVSSFYNPYYPTIKPPTQLKMGTNSSLIVNGKLTVAGQSSGQNNVVFTSLSGTTPGSWGSIVLSGAGASGSNLNYFTMQYGTRIDINTSNVTIQHSTIDFIAPIYGANGVMLQSGSSASLSYSTIRNARYGVCANGGLVSIDHCTITNCASGVYSFSILPSITHSTISNNGTGIHVENAGVEANRYIYNNTIRYNTHGIGLINSSPRVLNNNTISNNGGYGIYCYNGSAPCMCYNMISGNALDGIHCEYNSPAHLGAFYGDPGRNVIRQNGRYGVYANSSNVFMGSTAHGLNSDYSNTPYAVYAINNSTVLAQDDYWGRPYPISNDFYTASGGSITAYPYLSHDPNIGMGKSSAAASSEVKGEPLNASAEQSIFSDAEFIAALDAMVIGKHEEAITQYKVKYKKETNINKKRYALQQLAECYRSAEKKGFIDFLDKEVKTKLRKDDSLFTTVLELESIALMSEKNYDKAKDNYITLKTEYAADGEKYKHALFNLGILYSHYLNDTTKGKEYFAELKSKYPDDDLTWQSKMMSGDMIGIGIRKSFEPENEKEETTTTPIEDTYELYQNYPSPFNPTTMIRYQLPHAGIQYIVSLRVYDILGREVAVLVDGTKEAGSYTATFDGSKLSSGVYFVRFTAQPADGAKPFIKTMKMALTK